MEGIPNNRMKKPCRVLIVDDDHHIREILGLFCGKLGLEVCGSVSDGSEAVDFISREGGDADLILLDLVMKKLHGNVALPIIKSKKPHSKVIVISAFFMDYNSHFLANLGADGFLEKPVTFEGFASAVAEVAPLALPNHYRNLLAPDKGTGQIMIQGG